MMEWKVFSKINECGVCTYFPMFKISDATNVWELVSENEYKFGKKIVATDDESQAISYHFRESADKFIKEVKDEE